MSFAKCACIFDRASFNKIIKLTLRFGKHLETGIETEMPILVPILIIRQRAPVIVDIESLLWG